MIRYYDYIHTVGYVSINQSIYQPSNLTINDGYFLGYLMRKQNIFENLVLIHE